MRTVTACFTLAGSSSKDRPTATLERAQAMPGQGVTSTFSTGRGFGIWEGILGALDVPCRTARPIVWTKKVLAGVSGEGKERAIRFALRMFPGCDLTPEGSRKPKDGRAYALCLAYYGTYGALWSGGAKYAEY